MKEWGKPNEIMGEEDLEEYFDEQKNPEHWRAKELISACCCSTNIQQAAHSINFLNAGGTEEEVLYHLASVIKYPTIIFISSPLYAMIPPPPQLNRYGVDFTKFTVFEAFRLEESQISRLKASLIETDLKSLIQFIFHNKDTNITRVEKGLVLGYFMHKVLIGAGIVKAEVKEERE